MDQPPKKRRWQFSLKVLFIAITMAGVGMGMMRLGWELDMLSLPQEGIPLLILRLILLTASPGVLIGYGYNLFRGAIIGGMASVGAFIVFYCFFQLIIFIIIFIM